jgi:hypothetical protein
MSTPPKTISSPKSIFTWNIGANQYGRTYDLVINWRPLHAPAKTAGVARDAQGILAFGTSTTEGGKVVRWEQRCGLIREAQEVAWRKTIGL